VFNVHSAIYVGLFLTIHSQTELAINPHVAVSNIRHDIVNTHTIISELRHNVVKTQAIVSDIHRTVLKSQEGTDGQHQLVGDTRTLYITE